MSFYDLDETSRMVKQPAGLKIKLKPHQLTSIAAMRELETNSSIVIDQPQIGSEFYNVVRYRVPDLSELTGSTFTLETNSAILADKVGAGKTFMVVGLILEKTVPQAREKVIQGSDNYTIKMISNKEAVKTNLIVVPHNLSNQWADFISKSKLKCLKLNSENDFDVFFDEEYVDKYEYDIDPTKYVIMKKTRLRSIPGVKVKKTSGSKSAKKVNPNSSVYRKMTFNKDKLNKILAETDVIILNVKRYSFFVGVFRNIRWARVIIDEMDSVMIPMTFNEYGNFNWFLTATPTGIFYNSARRYVNKIFGHQPQILKYFTVKNKDEYVDKSMILPSPHVFIIETMLQRLFAAVKELVPVEVMNLINAGNVKEAINKLNDDVDTHENIVNVLTNQIKKELHNLEAELKYNEQLIPADADAHEKKIKRIKADISSCKDRLQLVHDRLDSIKDEDCFICASKFEMPTVMTCCKSVFCFKCLMDSMKIADNKCPYCRKIVGKHDYKIIVDKKDRKTKSPTKKFVEKYSKKDKPDVLYDLLHYISTNTEKPRILIFSDYSETFVKIQQHITKAGLQYQHISGTPGHIANVIDEFNKGVTNVLMLDSQHYGSGLNLQSADYLILYHRMKPELETQVIGRAQRYGRKERLRIIYLINDQESKITPMSKNPLMIRSADELWNITDPVKTNVDDDIIESDTIDSIDEVDKKKQNPAKKVKSIKKAIKKDTNRKGPNVSATKYKPGTKKLGNDGNMWIIKVSSAGVHRWSKHKDLNEDEINE